MRTYEIEPGVGIAPVRTGMPRDEAREKMPKERTEITKELRGTADTWHETKFQIYYDEAGHVRDIEISRSGEFDVVLKGIQVFEEPSGDVLRKMSKISRVEPTRSSMKLFSYPSLQLILWRDHEDDELPFDTVKLTPSN